MQTLINAGINAFGAQLLAESYLKSPMAKYAMERGEPLKFFLPINRSDCARWSGVEISISAISATGQDESKQPKGEGMKTGIEMIAAERQRQVEGEGVDAAHDDLHYQGELALAACYYAFPETHVIEDYGLKLEVTPDFFFPREWNQDWAGKEKDTRIRQLVKAGALIAAEIDRLIRVGV